MSDRCDIQVQCVQCDFSAVMDCNEDVLLRPLGELMFNHERHSLFLSLSMLTNVPCSAISNMKHPACITRFQGQFLQREISLSSSIRGLRIVCASLEKIHSQRVYIYCNTVSIAAIALEFVCFSFIFFFIILPIWFSKKDSRVFDKLLFQGPITSTFYL